MAADVAGLRGGRAPRRRAARRRPVVGPALRLQRRAAADRALAGRGRDAHEHAQDRRLADAERDAARRRQRPRRRRRGRRARCGCCARPARRRCCSRRSTARAGSWRCTASSCCTRRSRRSRWRARSWRRSRASRSSTRALVGRMGVAGYDPLRIVLDVRGTGRTGYEIADELRRSYDVHVELPMQATIVFVVGLGDTAAALRRLAGDVDEVVKRRLGARRDRADRPARRRAGQRGRRCRRARRSSARPSRSPSTPRSGASRASRSRATRPASPPCCRGSGSPPRRSPTCASWPTAARGCTAPATRPSRPSTSSWRRRDRPAGALGAVRREARLRGPAHVRRRAVHRGSRGARGLRRGDRRRADGRPRLRPPRRAARAARDPRGELARPGRTSRSRSTRSPSCGWSTSATRR